MINPGFFYTFRKNGMVQSYHQDIDQALYRIYRDYRREKVRDENWSLSKNLPNSISLLRGLRSCGSVCVAYRGDDFGQELTVVKGQLDGDFQQEDICIAL